jgi:hypothetical protein
MDFYADKGVLYPYPKTEQCMSLRQTSKLGKCLLILSGVFLLAYTWLGVIGLSFFEGHIRGARDVFFVMQPFFAFPIFLINIKSVKVSTWLLWLYVGATCIYDAALSWPHFDMDLPRADWGLFLAAIIQQIVLSADYRRRRVSHV